MNLESVKPIPTAFPPLYRFDEHLTETDKMVMDFLTPNRQLSLDLDAIFSVVMEGCSLQRSKAAQSIERLMSLDYIYRDFEGNDEELGKKTTYINACPIKVLMSAEAMEPNTKGSHKKVNPPCGVIKNAIDGMCVVNGLRQISKSNILGRINTARVLTKFFEEKGPEEELLSIIVGENMEPDQEEITLRQKCCQPQMAGILVSSQRVYVYRDMARLAASEAGDFEFEPVENKDVRKVTALRAWPLTSIIMEYMRQGDEDNVVISVHGNLDSSGKVLAHLNNGFKSEKKNRLSLEISDYEACV